MGSLPFRPGSVDYDGEMSTHFDAARALSPGTVEAWRVAVRRRVAAERPRLVLDLGSGTGRFSHLLAEWLDAEVLAVEPSSGMRSQARRGRRVHVIGGAAQAMPLRSSSCDLAWLSNVIHHVPDMRACATELARVLRPGRPVLLRTTFGGRVDGISLWQYFPGARRVANAFPTLEETTHTFEAAGFRVETLDQVRQPTAPRLADMVPLIRLRADTTLALLDDEEFASGMAALEQAADREPDKPVVDFTDLLTLRLP